MELPVPYSMLKQVIRKKYVLRAALCGTGMYSGMRRNLFL